MGENAVNLDLGFRATVSLKPNLAEWLSVETKTSSSSGGGNGGEASLPARQSRQDQSHTRID